MHLTYRGLLYKANLTPARTVETEIIAQYRGGTYPVRQLQEPPHQPRWFYRYRGTAYMTGFESCLSEPERFVRELVQV